MHQRTAPFRDVKFKEKNMGAMLPPQSPPPVGRGHPIPLGASTVAPLARETLLTQLKNTARASAPAP